MNDSALYGHTVYATVTRRNACIKNTTGQLNAKYNNSQVWTYNGTGFKL